MASQAANPLLGATEVLNDLVPSTETVQVSDGTPSVTAAAAGTWGNGTWGLGTWT